MNPETIQLALSVTVVGTATLLLTAWVGTRAWVPLPALTSYLAHVGIGSALYLSRGLGPDAAYYHLGAEQLLAYWTGDATNHPNFSIGKEAWPALLATLYRVAYPTPVLGLLVNACACGLLVAVLASTARRLDLPVQRTAWLIALLPPVLYWGSLLLREPLAWLLAACAAYALAGLVRRDALRDWLIFGASIAALMWVRSDAAVITAAGGFLAVLLARRSAGPLAVGAAMVLVALGGPLAARFTSLLGGYSIEQFNTTQEALSRTADTSGFETTAYGGYGDLVLGLPLRLPRSLLGPFPWEWPSLNPMFALDAVLWLALLYFAWRGWKRTAEPKRRLLALALPAAVLVAGLAITAGNYGTMQRLRIQAEVLLVPIAAAGMGRPESDTAGEPRVEVTAR